jgi:predicted site-specific integrase-resolvase
MEDGTRVTIEQAAQELQVSQATVRSWMRHQYIDIGIADKKDGNKKYCYIIYRKLLNEQKERWGITD